MAQNKQKHTLLFNNPANTIFFLTHFLSGIVLVCFLKKSRQKPGKRHQKKKHQKPLLRNQHRKKWYNKKE